MRGQVLGFLPCTSCARPPQHTLRQCGHSFVSVDAPGVSVLPIREDVGARYGNILCDGRQAPACSKHFLSTDTQHTRTEHAPYSTFDNVRDFIKWAARFRTGSTSRDTRDPTKLQHTAAHIPATRRQHNQGPRTQHARTHEFYQTKATPE